ncbi:MAG TPA: Hsp20/alpha crystallin family protein [Roseiflexaceae bacterium]|nr:Hsp20/alpha crystallin family protein [Roseiflexaceae bacterium]HEU5102151.1 Hsp20/alpha crystallin family protein [Roseiflexaceae bacterium]
MATITRWDPFQDMLSLREAMNQLMEESFVRPAAGRSGQGFVPALDLSETADGYLVEAAVPGLNPEDLEITVENNVLTIKGETHQEVDDKQRNYHRVERRFGSFQRTVGLPTTVKADAIHAQLTNGVLRLEIPKAEEVKPRKISVNIGENKAIEAAKNN